MLIGEVARRSGVSARMLRHYESLGLITPSERTSTGYREYSPADIGRIFHIEGLRKLGLSLPEAGKILAHPDFEPEQLIRDLIVQTRGRIAAEQELLDRLQSFEELQHENWGSVLSTVDLLRSLESRDLIQRHKAALGSGVDDYSVPAGALARAVLHETIPNVAGTLRWALTQAGGDGVPVLVAGAEDPNPEVRLNAVLALAEILRNVDWSKTADEGASSQSLITDTFISRLGDDEAGVRAAAAIAAGNSGDDRAIETLLRMIEDGTRDIETAEILGNMATDAEVGERILASLGAGLDGAEREVRLRITQALAEIPIEGSRQLLRRLEADDDVAVARVAMAILASKH